MVQALSVTVGAALVAMASTVSEAQNYPNRPIRIIDAFPAGGAGDVVARIVAPHLSTGLGQSIVIENRPGAAGNIGADVAAKSPPDGYTIFMGASVVLAPSRTLYPKLPYDALKDFAPVGRVGSTAYVLAVHPSMPVKSVKELIALARARPGQINYASGGVGSGQHLAGELLRMRAGIDIAHVAYKGGPPAVMAVASGETAVGFMTVPAGLSQINAGRMRAIATSGKLRTPPLDKVPTIAESGFSDYDVTPVLGLFVPSATPKTIVAQLNGELRRAVDLPDVKERFIAQGVIAASSTPEELGRILADEIALWAKVIKSAGIRVD